MMMSTKILDNKNQTSVTLCLALCRVWMRLCMRVNTFLPLYGAGDKVNSWLACEAAYLRWRKRHGDDALGLFTLWLRTGGARGSAAPFVLWLKAHRFFSVNTVKAQHTRWNYRLHYRTKLKLLSTLEKQMTLPPLPPQSVRVAWNGNSLVLC